MLVTVDAIGWTWDRVRTCVECGAEAITARGGVVEVVGDEVRLEVEGSMAEVLAGEGSPLVCGNPATCLVWRLMATMSSGAVPTS